MGSETLTNESDTGRQQIKKLLINSEVVKARKMPHAHCAVRNNWLRLNRLVFSTLFALCVQYQSFFCQQ